MKSQQKNTGENSQNEYCQSIISACRMTQVLYSFRDKVELMQNLKAKLNKIKPEDLLAFKPNTISLWSLISYFGLMLPKIKNKHLDYVASVDLELVSVE